MKSFSLFILLIIVTFSCAKKELVVTEVHTNTVQNITSNSATCGGEVTSTGDPDVTVKGICWSTTTSPTIADNKIEKGAGLGSFSITLTELEAETSYYIRAYALIDSKTVYGFQEQFTTLEEAIVPVLPTVTTATITNITASSATGGGEITQDGGASITARGIYWSTIPNPTSADNTILDGSVGEGSFISNLIGLEASTTYYLKAFATNSIGTAYGDELNFSTTCDGDVYVGDITLTTQGAINTFGANCINQITGDLSIEEAAPGAILDLSPLLGLTEVGGDVMIENNTTLSTLEGLDNLITVGGDFYLNLNHAMPNIDELSNLAIVGGNLRIGRHANPGGNDSLQNIDGLNGVTSVGGMITICGNDALINLDGLSNISTNGSGVNISLNQALINVDGLTGITHATDYLLIQANQSLTSIDGLSNITTMGEGQMWIVYNDALTNLNGLSGLTSVNADLHITANDVLVDLCGLTPLITTAGGLSGTYIVTGNAYNPTQQDIIDGNCSL